MIFKIKKKEIIFAIFIGMILVFPTLFILNTMNNINDNNSIEILSSDTSNYSGDYEGDICTMGLKLNSTYSLWNNTDAKSLIIPNNRTIESFIYSLGALDIRAFNIFDGFGDFDIANDSSTPIPIGFVYGVTQEFTTKSTPEVLAIEKVELYLQHGLIGLKNYLYYLLLWDENFEEVLGYSIVPIGLFNPNDWISFDLSSNILQGNTKYHFMFLIGEEGYTPDDIKPVLQNAWKAQNTGTNMGLTQTYDLVSLTPIANDDTRDMLCNFTYRNLINPEEVDLTCNINGIDYKPTYQKSISEDSLGYEAILSYNFESTPMEEINITITTNETVDFLMIEVVEYDVYLIRASGHFNVTNNMIEWNITYPYYDIGAYGWELWFLYESDWQLKHFYDTFGNELEVFFGPISLFNHSYYGLFDLWYRPLGVGNCRAIYQSPNYCSHINTKIKVGENFQDRGYLQLGKTIKLEAEIRDSFNNPISGGLGNITFRNPSGTIIYQGVNITSYNGILNSSEISLPNSYSVGMYEIDIFWTDGKEIAFYTMFVEVRHPEGYIAPETYMLIAFLIGIAASVMPISLVARKYIRQRNWEKTLHDLFVLSKQGVSMYSYSFGIEMKKPELISGMISALSSFIKEATGSKQALRTIDQQDKKLILNQGDYIMVALLCDKDLPIIHKRISKFTESFENKYGKYLLSWRGEQSLFKSAEGIVTKYFPVSMEEQVIRGVHKKLFEFRERLLSIEDPMQIISMMREITEFSSRYQEIINKFAFKDFNELIRISEEKIQNKNS